MQLIVFLQCVHNNCLLCRFKGMRRLAESGFGNDIVDLAARVKRDGCRVIVITVLGLYLFRIKLVVLPIEFHQFLDLQRCSRRDFKVDRRLCAHLIDTSVREVIARRLKAFKGGRPRQDPKISIKRAILFVNRLKEILIPDVIAVGRNKQLRHFRIHRRLRLIDQCSIQCRNDPHFEVALARFLQCILNLAKIDRCITRDLQNTGPIAVGLIGVGPGVCGKGVRIVVLHLPRLDRNRISCTVSNRQPSGRRTDRHTIGSGCIIQRHFSRLRRQRHAGE